VIVSLSAPDDARVVRQGAEVVVPESTREVVGAAEAVDAEARCDRVSGDRETVHLGTTQDLDRVLIGRVSARMN
jgi:hypothetical protein